MSLSITCKHVQYLSDKNQKPEDQIFVINSGAFPHMWNDYKSFVSFTKWNETNNSQKVTLADGVSTAQIKGIGSVLIKIKNNIHKIDKVLYVPELSTSLLSVKQHCTEQGCYYWPMLIGCRRKHTDGVCLLGVVVCFCVVG